MSYFYLKPVMGNVSLHLLEECVLKRWQYFQENVSSDAGNFCQYVIEGSSYDNIGHFMLNFLANFSSDRDLISAVTNYEGILFYKRIQFASSNDLRILCKNILKAIKDVQSEYPQYFYVLDRLCRNMLLKHIAQHVSDVKHDNECSNYSIKTHFTLCLPLIATRQVEINNGYAVIPCGKWKKFLQILFRTHLKFRNDNINKQCTKNIDPRWRELLLKVTQNFSFSVNRQHLNHKEVDKKSELFPPCMNHLHRILRAKHRLSHDDRFRFSLFLKDVGMPLQQSLLFWQKEYSKPCNGKSACTHEWDKDSKKYVYGIRHLYGLEGSRKSYRMVNCCSIQQRATAEGGCPFKHFDLERLKKCIDFNATNEQTWNSILESIQLKRSTEACNIYKHAMISHMRQDQIISDVKISTPVDYFNELNSIPK